MKSPDSTYDMRISAQPLGLFETPLALGELTNGEPLLNDLETLIRNQMTLDSGLQRSNRGGWHSNTNMLEWGGTAANALAETAIRMATRMTWFKDSRAEDFRWSIQMWANVTGPGGYNDLHVHPGNLWAAAVLYLRLGNEQPGAPNPGGNFYVEDPRFPMVVMRDPGLRLRGVNGTPQQLQTELQIRRGNLLVFPAWLRHGVRNYHGEGERISIALNLDAVPLR